jgi:hypothetical protein
MLASYRDSLVINCDWADFNLISNCLMPDSLPSAASILVSACFSLHRDLEYRAFPGLYYSLLCISILLSWLSYNPGKGSVICHDLFVL